MPYAELGLGRVKERARIAHEFHGELVAMLLAVAIGPPETGRGYHSTSINRGQIATCSGPKRID